MIIKKIAALCKSVKGVTLFDDEENGIQWITDGYAVYPLYDMPRMDGKTILAVLDVPGEKLGEFRVRSMKLPTNLNFNDDDDNERMLPEMDIGILFRNMKIIPARTSRGLWFFNPKYLEPLNDLDGFEIYERKDKDGKIYFAIKTGFMLQAIIMPMLPEPEVLAGRLRRLADELETTLHYQTAAEDDSQLHVDADTGEVIA